GPLDAAVRFERAADAAARRGGAVGTRQGVDRDHRRRPHGARRDQVDDGRGARDPAGLGAPEARPGPSPCRSQRSGSVDDRARMDVARRDAWQYEPRPDPRSGRVRTRQLPYGAPMNTVDSTGGSMPISVVKSRILPAVAVLVV